MEGRIQEALQYIGGFPHAKIATVAREFGVPRGRLRYRLEGRTALSDRPPTHAKLTVPEEMHYVAILIVLIVSILQCVLSLLLMRQIQS